MNDLGDLRVGRPWRSFGECENQDSGQAEREAKKNLRVTGEGIISDCGVEGLGRE